MTGNTFGRDGQGAEAERAEDHEDHREHGDESREEAGDLRRHQVVIELGEEPRRSGDGRRHAGAGEDAVGHLLRPQHLLEQDVRAHRRHPHGHLAARVVAGDDLRQLVPPFVRQREDEQLLGDQGRRRRHHVAGGAAEIAIDPLDVVGERDHAADVGQPADLLAEGVDPGQHRRLADRLGRPLEEHLEAVDAGQLVVDQAGRLRQRVPGREEVDVVGVDAQAQDAADRDQRQQRRDRRAPARAGAR